MTDRLKPRDAKDVEDVVTAAVAERRTLDIVGHATKRDIGRPAQWDLTLDMSGLSGVTHYEPEELVLSAKAGTPLAEIETLVAARGQELAFEPMDYGPIFGPGFGRGTIGGALAANLSGPRRVKAGAARDHFLGVSAVSGRGETFKSGGRVVKNVTGYDLCKVLAGSFGTLAAMTEVTIKVLPRAETEQTVFVTGLDDARAMQAMSLAMGSPAEVSGAAHLPGPVATRAADGVTNGQAMTAFRLEGVPPSIAQRKSILEVLLKPFGAVAPIAEGASRRLWRAIRDVTPFAAAGPAGTRTLWRVSTVPSRAEAFAFAVAREVDAEVLYDWAGGLVWLALAPQPDGGAATVRRALADAGGHATLIRAPAAVRASVAVFEPQEGGVAALTRRVKESFDPGGVLGPGRMWAGI